MYIFIIRYIYHIYIYIYIYIYICNLHLFYPLVGEVLLLETCFTTQPARSITNIQNTSRRNNLSNSFMIQSMGFSSLLTNLLSFQCLARLQIKKGFHSSCSHILMNIPSMNYYNYFVTKFLTERSTNLQMTFQDKKLTGVQKQQLADALKNRCF